MKNVFSIWSMVVLMTMSAGFSSCSKDDDDDEGNSNDSSLVGKWEGVEDFEWENGKWESSYEYKAGECIWTFDQTHLFVQDPNDAFNGQKVTYSYNSSKKELTLVGWVRPVLKLTSTELEIDNSIGGMKAKTSFKKIQ
jgi:hypothetical protein